MSGKTVIRIFTGFAVAALLACAAKTLKEDPNMKIGEIKEYQTKVSIKEIEGQKTPKPEEVIPVAPSPTPGTKLGMEPVLKIERKGKKDKKKGQPELPFLTSDASGPRQPAWEDTEGFNGRRPIVDPFRPGEKVTLMLTYFGVSAGDGTLEVHPFVEVNGRKAYHFFGVLKSSPVFSMFYKVDDWCEAHVDYEELVPLTFSISANESKQIREVRQFFDWRTKKADYWEKRRTPDSPEEEKKKNWDLEPFAQNIYSAAQYARVFQLREGKTYIYHVSDDSKTWAVKAYVDRKELLKTDIGTFKTVVVRPEVSIDGILKPMGEVLVWYTDDDRKFLVKFEAKIKIGKLIGYLKALDKGGP